MWSKYTYATNKITKIPSFGSDSAAFHSLKSDMIMNNADAEKATSNDTHLSQLKSKIQITFKISICVMNVLQME
jgi:hypothetical protein